MLTPMGAPRVSNVPELLAIFGFTPSDNGNFVDGFEVASVITEDTSLVVIESLRDSNRARNRASLPDLLHHVLFSTDIVVLVNIESSELVRNVAGLARVAVTADVHG